MHVNADFWPPLQTHPHSWLPISGWPGQGTLRIALWEAWPYVLRSGRPEDTTSVSAPCVLWQMLVDVLAGRELQLICRRTRHGVVLIQSLNCCVLFSLFSDTPGFIHIGKPHNSLAAAAQNAAGIDPWAGPILWKCICGEKYVLVGRM